MGPPYGKRAPYHGTHIFRDSYGSGMGIVWEAYHKGVPLLGVPGVKLHNLWVLSPEFVWKMYFILGSKPHSATHSICYIGV